jgi:hypothetical protein
MTRRAQTNFTAASMLRGGPAAAPVLTPAAPAVARPPAGTAREVLAWVGDSAERATQAIEAEQATMDPRKVLIRDLTKIASPRQARHRPSPDPVHPEPEPLPPVLVPGTEALVLPPVPPAPFLHEVITIPTDSV